MLKLYVPSDEEITTLRAYEGPVASLGIAERFFLEILDVHILKSLFPTTFTMLKYLIADFWRPNSSFGIPEGSLSSEVRISQFFFK